MSKKRKKTDFPEAGSFVPLYREMLKSPAWQDLSHTAKLAYISIKSNHFGDNAKEIICPHSTIINQMSPTTWAKAIRELQAHGFIIIVRETRGLGRLPNIYALSNNWKHWEPDKPVGPKITTHSDPYKGFSKLWKEDPERMKQLRRDRVKK